VTGRNKITLIGYRATGKSTVGKRLSERLNITYADADDVIEERACKTIAAIFSEDGEPSFRDLEARVVAELLSSPDPLVLATGGGAPMRESTRLVLKERSVVIWLTASVDTIAARMHGDARTASSRPTLTNAQSPVAEISAVLNQREPLYRAAATFEVDTEHRSIDEVVDEILRLAPHVFK
jgi:shikimate kinase